MPNIHQDFEKDWWGDCGSTLYEEQKQLVYARLMGLEFEWDGPGPRIDLQDKSVLDIGGGPVSMLLKAKNKGKWCEVLDPCDYPTWVTTRYVECGIVQNVMSAEDIRTDWIHIFDEVWIYNCLQHTIDPEKIIQNARRISKIIRIFEWVDTGTSLGHPHELKEDKLNEWLGGVGRVQQLNENGCVGKSYSGIFLGDHYET